MKPILLTSILVTIIQFSSFSQQQVIGCYPLDGNANDYSSNTYSGSINNVYPTSDRNNNEGMAMHFSGSSSSIQLPVGPFELDEYTYSIWFKLDEIPSEGSYFAVFSVGGNATDQSLMIGNSPSRGHVGIGFGSYDIYGQPHHCYSDVLPDPNEWYHVVISRNNSEMIIYVNNELICSTTTGMDAGYQGTTSNTFSIGSRGQSNAQNFIGDIDQFKIFNTVLTPSSPELNIAECSEFTSVVEVNNTNNSILAFINQSTKKLHVSSELMDYQLLNIVGEVITSSRLKVFDVSNLSSGVYMIHGKTQKGDVISQKLIIY